MLMNKKKQAIYDLIISTFLIALDSTVKAHAVYIKYEWFGLVSRGESRENTIFKT